MAPVDVLGVLESWKLERFAEGTLKHVMVPCCFHLAWNSDFGIYLPY